MTTNQMREWLKAKYKGKSWAVRVSRMSDNQVIAIYRRLYAKETAK